MKLDVDKGNYLNEIFVRAGWRDVNKGSVRVTRVLQITSYALGVISLGIIPAFVYGGLWCQRYFVLKKSGSTGSGLNTEVAKNRSLNQSSQTTKRVCFSDPKEEAASSLPLNLDLNPELNPVLNPVLNPELNVTTIVKCGCFEETIFPRIQLVDLENSQYEIKFQEMRGIQLFVAKKDILDPPFNHKEGGKWVIVNAANSHLGGGSGIDGAICKAGGENYKKAQKGILGYSAYQKRQAYIQGHATMITGGDLVLKGIENVIVVCGPTNSDRKHDPNEADSQLYSCYYNSLILADRQKKTDIVFPLISTGAFGYEFDVSLSIFLKAADDFIKTNPSHVRTISIHGTDQRLLETLRSTA